MKWKLLNPMAILGLTGFIFICAYGVIWSYYKSTLPCWQLGCNSEVSISFEGHELPDSYTVEIWYPAISPKDGYIKYECIDGIITDTKVTASDNVRHNFMHTNNILDTELYGDDYNIGGGINICEEFFVRVPRAPYELTVRVTWDEDNYQETIIPDYTVFHPNGENCPPTCRNAEIKIEIS